VCDGRRRGFDGSGASVPGRAARSDRDRLCEGHCRSRGEGSRRPKGRRKPTTADTRITGPESRRNNSRGFAAIVIRGIRRFRRGTAAGDPGADRRAANRPRRGAFANAWGETARDRGNSNARRAGVHDTCNSNRCATVRSFDVPDARALGCSCLHSGAPVIDTDAGSDSHTDAPTGIHGHSFADTDRIAIVVADSSADTNRNAKGCESNADALPRADADRNAGGREITAPERQCRSCRDAVVALQDRPGRGTRRVPIGVSVTVCIAVALTRPMPPRRIYPRWRPPTPAQRVALRQIRRMQRHVMIWLVAFIPAGWVVIALTSSDAILVPFTLLWIAAGIALARRVTAIRCPRCAANFCEKSRLPYWYGLFNRRCENCGLTLFSDDHPDQPTGAAV
jgi:hypothetical protein